MHTHLHLRVHGIRLLYCYCHWVPLVVGPILEPFCRRRTRYRILTEPLFFSVMTLLLLFMGAIQS